MSAWYKVLEARRKRDEEGLTFNYPLGATWQYRRRPNYWGLILISAILILGSVGILKIAEDAIARQDRIQQEEIQ